MKKTNVTTIAKIAFVIFGIAALQSCTKIGKLLNLNLGMQTESVNVTIPVTTGVNGVVTVGPSTNYYNVDSFIKAQTGGQLGASNISSVKLASVVFKLNNSNTFNNFQNFESCSASFYSDANNTPYKVSIDNNPDSYSNSLSLPVDTTTEFKSYIGTNFYYIFNCKLRRPTTIPLDCTVTFAFNVRVQG